jgi:hypothetical protein
MLLNLTTNEFNDLRQEKIKLRPIDLRRVLNCTYNEFQRQHGYFPTYEVVRKNFPYHELKFLKIIELLERWGILEQTDGKTQDGLCIPLVKIHFDSSLIRLTKAERRGIKNYKKRKAEKWIEV